MPSKPVGGDSWRVQFRLNRALSEIDRQILDKMIAFSDEGYSDHDICVPALAHYYLDKAGVPESGDVRNLKEIAVQLNEIKRLSTDKIQLLINILAGRGIHLTDDERDEIKRGLDDATVERIFSGVTGEQFEIDD